MQKLKYYFNLFALPLSLFFIFVTLNVVWKIFHLPPSDVLLDKVRTWFDVYGLPVLFLSAILEGMLLIGGYFPGVFIIFVSVLLAKTPIEAAVSVGVATAGLLTAHSLNYILGRFGWYKLITKLGARSSVEKSKEKILRKGGWAIFASYWLPSVGALIDTAAGIVQMPFKRFFTYSILSSFFWNTLVGTIVYFVGINSLAFVGSGQTSDIPIQLAVVVVWMMIILALDYKKKKKAPEI